MFCTVCASFNGDRRPDCSGCGAALRTAPGTGRPDLTGRARAIAGLLPVVALLVALLTVVGRSWQLDRLRADEYRAAEVAMADGRLLSARAGFARLEDYRDADDREAELDALIGPLEVRTRLAGELVSGGQSASAILELRDIVSRLPDHQEAVLLLEQARRTLAEQAITEADRQLAAGDIVGARAALTAGLRLEPTSSALRVRLDELDARHPLLLLTNDGDVAVTEFGGDRQRVIMTGQDASWAVWSPDRTRAAFMSVPEEGEDWSAALWMLDADGGGQRMLADNAFRFGAPSWSPDGLSLVYVTMDDFDRTLGRGWVGLRMIDLETGERRDLTGRRFHFTTSVVWSPDGRQIAFVERHIYRTEDAQSLGVRGGDVFLLDLSTGESRNLTKGRIRDAYWVSWSPRGDEMLITTDVDGWASADPNRLVRLDVTTGAIEDIETRGIVTSYPYWSPDGTMFALAQDDRVVRVRSEAGESWVRLPTNVDATLSWAPDGSAIIVPPKNVQDATHVIHVGERLGEIDTIRVMFDNSYISGGPPQWGARTQAVADEPLPSGTALD